MAGQDETDFNSDEDSPPLGGRVEADSPFRCHGIRAQGDQCQIRQVEGSKYCIMHGGAMAKKAAASEARRLYDLAIWAGRVDALGGHEKVFSLRADLGLLRLTLEALVQSCKNSGELVVNYQKIAYLVSQIRETVKEARKLESILGDLLDRAVIDRLCDNIVVAASKHLAPEALTAFADDVASAVSRAVIDARKDDNDS